MGGGFDRRDMLALGGVAWAAGAAPAMAAVPARAGRAGVLFFDPASPEACGAAQQAQGVRLVALAGDPVRLWRDTPAAAQGPVAGITRWSDYLVLRGLAEEHGLRLRAERRLNTVAGALIVHWQMG